MTTPAIQFQKVSKRYRFFALEGASFELEQGQIMGFVGPNGAGKTTSIRILMGLVHQDEGDVRLLGHPMPAEQAEAKRDVGYVSDDMRLFGNATIAWHMDFMRSIYTGWDDAYAKALLKRFYLHAEQQVKGLSHGERVKALLLLVLARRPRLLVLDEPTSGLDPVARHEAIAEFMDVLRDDDRSILFSSHNTIDVEQISDQITFIDRGRIIDSADKESFLDRWRTLRIELPARRELETVPGIIDVSTNGHIAVATTNTFTPDLVSRIERTGVAVRDIRRMTLEEIFVANVMYNRKERGE